MAVIFDLDMTMIKSDQIEPLRRNRLWGEVYKVIPSMELFCGIKDLVQDLKRNQIKTAIVTSSPSSYCSRVVEHFGINVDVMVCYHDTNNHKPHPEPILKAISLLEVSHDSVIAIGDAPGDIVAAKAAKTLSVAALWGTSHPDLLVRENPDFLFDSVEDFRYFLFDHFLT
jgi:HAD superfamily hydrolase (TIGR01549 family)